MRVHSERRPSRRPGAAPFPLSQSGPAAFLTALALGELELDPAISRQRLLAGAFRDRAVGTETGGGEAAGVDPFLLGQITRAGGGAGEAQLPLVSPAAARHRALIGL